MLGKAIGGVGAWIAGAISAMGYGGIVLLMAIESACIPLPSEVIMPFAGYLVSTGRFNLWLAATAGAFGSCVGSAVAYAAGFYGGRPFVLHWGRYVLLSPEDLGRAERFFDRFGAPAVLIGRVLPVIRTFIALPAGIARMPHLRFQIYTFVGSWPWCFGLAYVGYVLGRRWDTDPRLHAIMQRLDLVVVALVVLAVAWFLMRRVRRRRAA
ncbi:MAG TPA: DedA family protein [Acetobacteraceae bacterium]|nr:DedA family protein [Acetobacteraceae bacterium]